MFTDKVLFLLLKKEIAMKQEVELKVVGSSMSPILQENDIVKISPKSKYERGDLLAFLHSNQFLVVHRLVAKFNGFLYCKGDNSLIMEKTSTEYVLGNVSCFLRNGRFFKVPNVDNNFLNLSLRVGLLYHNLQFDQSKLYDNNLYKRFKLEYERIEADMKKRLS